MNVYDFDGTIYDGDSTFDFYQFCLGKYPAVILNLPMAGLKFLSYKLGLCTKTAFKEVFYRFLQKLPDVDVAVNQFWDSHTGKIKGWYLRQKETSDLIISASPEFLLWPICKKLGVNLIASRVDKQRGVTTGENCHGEEKVRRLYQQYPDAVIQQFYSDSKADTPLAKLAAESYMVKGNIIQKCQF